MYNMESVTFCTRTCVKQSIGRKANASHIHTEILLVQHSMLSRTYNTSSIFTKPLNI